jgi:hypothetical protein
MAHLSRIGKSVNVKPRTPEETYGPALQRAQKDFVQIDRHQVAVDAAVAYEPIGQQDGRYQVSFLGAIYHVHWPDSTTVKVATQEPADIATQILLLHYLLTADGTPMASKWIAFRNLPGGLGYDAAFQGRANLRLARAFGSDKRAFEAAARSLGGESLAFGDASYLFRALPRVWLAVVLHLADEEFPANANVLFDAAASHYLPTEDLAVLGGMVAGRLVKAGRSR